MSEFSDLLGQVIIKIDVNEYQINFLTIEGNKYRMSHIQDCCESVTLEDVCGDWADVMDDIITIAEERSSEEPDEAEKVRREGAKAKDGYYYSAESETWTFYKLGTRKGDVTLRWYGESNGYYSESVDFEEIGR